MYYPPPHRVPPKTSIGHSSKKHSQGKSKRTQEYNLFTAGGFGPMSIRDNSPIVTMTHASSDFTGVDEENKKLNSRIELLERKIRAKDQLFEESLASAMTTCSCNTPESQNLTVKLKKRVISLRGRLEEAENEIKRLTKTVKVVEIEVKEDSSVLREEIARLLKNNEELT
jgi:hypothetical protein